MKGAVLTVLCAVALTRGAVLINQNGCPVDYSIEKLLPHPNCAHYYQCIHGALFEMFCPIGLHFSVESNACDFPVAAKCRNQGVVPENPIVDQNDHSQAADVQFETDAKDEEDETTVAGHDDPSQAPAICAAEGSDGVLVAHETCNRFYKCSFGLPVVIRCPSTLLYEPSKERCEWPATVECGDRVILDDDNDDNAGGDWTGDGAGNSDPSQAPSICAAEGSDHIYIAHENCNQFYKCWAGVPVAMDCPFDHLFSPYKDYCDFPYNVVCGDRVIPDNHGSDTGNDNQGGDNNDNTEEVPSGNNHDDPSQALAICGSAGSDGVLVAHENCNQFYKCTFCLPVALICPGNLLFDPSWDRCEWRETVDCGNRVIPEINDNDGGSDWTGNGAGNDDPSQAPAICAAEGSDHIYIAHENCNQFYKCWAGVPVAMDCPFDHLFNPYKDYCDFPYNVVCGERVIPDNHGSDTGNDNQGGNGNDNTDEEVPSGNNHDDPSQALAICGSAGSDGVLVAHENCNQFYKCTFGLPVALICPGNLLFDPSWDRCEWRETVDCGNRVIPEVNDNDGGSDWTGNGAGNDDPSQAPAICAAEGSDHIYIAHENCNQFYKCWAGVPVAMDCPFDHLFNPYKDYCDFPYNVVCGDRVIPDNHGSDTGNDNQGGNGNDNTDEEVPSGNNHDDPSQALAICGSADSDGVLVAHENCNQFYKCTFGLPVALICPGNLLFDPSWDRCEWRETVDCGNRVIPEVNDNDGGSDWTGNGAGNDDPSQAPAICAAEDSDHIHIAHENCNQYYQCWAGLPVALNCPPNHFFNPNKDYCDFPHNVDCGNRLVFVA